MQVTGDAAAEQADHVHGVLQPHDVVVRDELEDARDESVPLPRVSGDVLVGAVIRTVTELADGLVAGAGVGGGELRVEPGGVIGHGHGDQPADPGRVTDGQLHGDGAAEAVAEDVGPRQTEMIEQRGQVVGEELIAQRPAGIRGSAVPRQLDGDDRRCAASRSV